MGKAAKRKWERRAKWPLSKGARLRKTLPVHEVQIVGLCIDAIRIQNALIDNATLAS